MKIISADLSLRHPAFVCCSVDGDRVTVIDAL